MSASVIHWESYKSLRILREHDTSGAALYVFWALCAHKNERGRAWPKIDTLQYETGFSRPVIIEAIKILISFGVVSKVKKEHRVDEELEIAYQRSMYQVHSTLTHKGESYPLLFNASNERKEVEVHEVNFNEVKVNEVNHYNVVPNKELNTKEEPTSLTEPQADGCEVEDSPLTDDWFQERKMDDQFKNIDALIENLEHFPDMPEKRKFSGYTKHDAYQMLLKVLDITSHDKRDMLHGAVAQWLWKEGATFKQVLRFMKWYQKTVPGYQLPKTLNKNTQRDGKGWQEFWYEWRKVAKVNEAVEASAADDDQYIYVETAAGTAKLHKVHDREFIESLELAS